MTAKDLCIKTQNLLSATPCDKVPRHLEEELALGLECALCQLPECIPSDGVVCNGTSVSTRDINRKIQSITVKVWLTHTSEPKHVREAVDTTLSDLGVDNADTLLVRFPSEIADQDLLAAWAQVETLFQSQKARRIGVCDMGVRQLALLLKEARFPPSLLELPLRGLDPGVVTELRRLCRDSNIRLITSGASREEDFNRIDLQSILKGRVQGVTRPPKPAWAARFTVVLRCRSIAATKGYIVHCPDAIDIPE
eukprot:TRINITY_DN3522_c0_g1_i1.p1 TRINITY_DN3522_c0_g1~~TRINITY_DN3522_c0_g1_i1.p1  ORF type:complete len:252 (-),score=10.56 TRINITY_DN3522_c0_g1_i1:67-822(-)